MRFRCAGRAIFSTLRAKILLAFLGLTAITGSLGLGAIHSVVASGRLVMHVYDEPLMAISHVRMAETDFAAMRLALARRESAADPGQRGQPDLQLAALAGKVEEDLGVARQRAGSDRAAEAAQAALANFRAWNVLRSQDAPDAAATALRQTAHRRAEALAAELDALRQVTADDDARDRARTIASIQRYRLWCIGATAAALLFGTIITVVLARHMVMPIAAASHAARRIAAGDLDAEIRPTGRDELGQLLAAMAVMRDNIRTMVEHEVAARRSAQGRLANAIEGLNEGIALIGADRRVILANAQLAAFFPAHATAFVEGAELPPETEAALANPTGEMQIADGRWLRLSRSERSDGGFVLIASDITLLKEREAVLQAAKEQAEAANRAKTEFLTNMSHELRTPLTAIIGFSEIIATEAFGSVGQPKYREFADDILHSGRHLLDVINDMLDIAKLQSGTTELRLRRVPSRSIIDAAVRIVRKKAEQAGISLELVLPRDNLPMIQADHVRLRQVLLNLLSNAIKFTPAGGTVSIIAEHCESGLAITVRDTGIGMAQEDIPRALQPFVQVDNSLARRHGGTGLGLPLSKLFVDLHGGQLDIHSEPGKGTSVSIVLPTPYSSPAILAGEVAA